MYENKGLKLHMDILQAGQSYLAPLHMVSQGTQGCTSSIPAEPKNGLFMIG
jgi:hypothetical protein